MKNRLCEDWSTAAEEKNVVTVFAPLATVSVDDAVKGLFKDRDWVNKTGIGGILAAAAVVAGLYHFACLPIVVACWALMVGYTLRVMRTNVADPKAKLPEWNEWGDLFLSGITWIAFQSIVWALMVMTTLVALSFCTMSASAPLAPDWQTMLWSIGAVVLPALTCLNLGYVATYVMVHFAVEENSKAAMAYMPVMNRMARHPAHYLTGFLLAIGIQWIAVILPAVTVVGLIVMPSCYFIGQVLSAVILAAFWRADPGT